MTTSSTEPFDFRRLEREPAILLKQIYPPTKKDLSGNSFLGGVPRLPEQLSWPSLTNGKPLHFLAQIDCGALPKSLKVDGNHQPVRGVPDKGILYFFIAGGIDDLEPDKPDAIRVLYWPDDLGDVAKCAVPDQLDELGEYSCINSHAVWSDKPKGIRGFRMLPRVPVLPQAYLSIRSMNALRLNLAMGAARDSDNVLETLDHLSKLKRESLDEVIQTPPYDGLPSMAWTQWGYPLFCWPWLADLELPWNRPIPDETPVANVPESFPWRWLMISRVALAIRERVIRKSHKHYPGEFDTALLKAWPHAIAEAEQWIARAEEKEPLEKVESGNSNEFRSWIRALLNAQNVQPSKSWIKQLSEINLNQISAYEKAAEDQKRTRMVAITGLMKSALYDGFFAAWPYIVASGDLSDIDAEFVEVLALGHLPRNYGAEHVHQMFGAEHSVQNVNVTQADKILLLQVSSDYGADMIWGDVGMLQFWINEENLRALNFDKVQFTIE